MALCTRKSDTIVEVTMFSIMQRKNITRDIPMNSDQYREYVEGKKKIQDIFPEMSADDREWLISGTTKEDWDKMFPEGDNE